MGGLYSRVKTWGATDTLTSTDLNAEFDNVLTNFIPTMLQGYSVNATQMQVQTSPGSVGSESLATALSGELERIRFMLATISGTTYWYQTPASSLAALNSALGASAQANKVTSALTAATTGISTYLVPDGTTNRVTAAGASTNLVYTVTSASYTISTNVTLAGLNTAPTTGNTCVISDNSITSGQAWTQLIGENNTTINIATVGAGITSLASKIGAFKIGTTGEYFIGRVNATATQIHDVYRGYFMGSASTWTARGNLTNGDTLTVGQLAWIYATTAGALTTSYTNPTYTSTAPSSPAISDYWFDMINNYWRTYNGSSWVTASATLIGIVVCDTTKAVGARSIDPYATIQTNNTLELFLDGNALIRPRNIGTSVSVFGTPVSFPKSYPTWAQTLYEGGNATTATTYYYLYLAPNGTTYTSTNAPYNRADLGGFYHPSAQWRCLGYVLTDTAASANFLNIESFYKTNQDFATVTTATAAWPNVPQPYIIPPRAQLYEFNCTSAAVTQGIPHPAQWKGQRLIYQKTDSSANPLNLQSFGLLALSTTATSTQGSVTLSTLGATTGLTAGTTYLVGGPGVPWGTTAVWTSGSTIPLSQNAFYTTTGGTYTFGWVPTGGGIYAGSNNTTVGVFNIPLYSQFESVELMSDGANVLCVGHNIPSQENWVNNLTITGSTTNPTKGTITYESFYWRRVANNCHWRWDGKFAGTGVGAGDYQIALPAPVNSIDLSRVQANAAVLGATLSGAIAVSCIGKGFISAAAPSDAAAIVMSTTQFKVLISGNGAWSSGVANNLGAAVSITLQGNFPVTSWWG